MNIKKMDGKYIILFVIALVIISLSIFAATRDDDRELTGIEKVFKDGVVFVQRVLSAPFKFVGSKISYYKDLRNVYTENLELKKQISNYENIMNENEALRDTIYKLEQLYSISNTLADYEYLNASVISRNVSVWYENITIDKGASNGVMSGMAVITPNGFLGTISNVSNFTSTVSLITNNSNFNKISVKVDNVYGLIDGYEPNSNFLLFEAVSDFDNIKKGDKIITSGLDGKYPKGFLVGYVNNVRTDEYDLSKIIEVTPSVNINSIEFVTVIKREKVE